MVSPSGLKIARMLKREYGMPYETGYPVEAESRREFTERILPELGSHILIVHQQIFANEIRKWIRERKPDAKVTVAGWFRMDGTLKEERDRHLDEESDLLKLVRDSAVDTVLGDPLLKRALPGWQGTYLDLPHYPVSGELHSVETSRDYWKKAGHRR